MLYSEVFYFCVVKILLILAANDIDPLKNLDPFMPLVFPILASVAPGHDYAFIDLLREKEASINYNGNYDLVGISYRVSASKKAFSIADRFRANGVPVILGGPQASTLPFEAIKHADAVVVGEGEQLWPVALNDMKNNELKSFYVSSPGVFQAKGYSVYQQKGFLDLKSMCLPRRDLIKGNYSFDVVFAARGCPIDCSFCSVSRLFGKEIRMKEVDSVVAEISTLRRRFYLVDDNVFGRPACYDKYLSLYTKIQQLKKKRFWTGQANLDAAASEKGRKVITEAAKSGFSFASIGIETINPNSQKNTGVDKKLGISNHDNMRNDLIKNISFIQSQGISVSGWFTIGLEHDTVESCMDTIKFCDETNIFPVFSPIQVFEGTRLHDQLKEEGKLIDKNSNVSNLKHPTLTNSDYIYILKSVLHQAYSKKAIFKRMIFHFKKFYLLKRGSYDLIYRLMYALIAQLRIKKIQAQEIKRFEARLKSVAKQKKAFP